MKIRTLVAAAHIGFLLVACGVVEGAELRVLSAIGMKEAMEDLGPKFERSTGHKLNTTFAIGGVIVKRIQNGETGDLVLLPRSGIDSLAKDGKLVNGSQVVVARSGIGVAVRKGAAKPDVSSPEAFKRALLSAKSITYSNPADGGASGVHFAKVLDRLGIAAEVKSKTVFPKIPGEIGQVVARGEAEIAVGQNQVLISVPEIEIVGPLPGDLQDTIVFSAALMTGAKEAAAARSLIDYLRTPEAVAEIKAKGMEPPAP